MANFHRAMGVCVNKVCEMAMLLQRDAHKATSNILYELHEQSSYNKKRFFEWV